MEAITSIITGIISAMGSFLEALNPASTAGQATPAIALVVGVTLASGIARKAVGTVKRFGK